ncbi:MAG TPA: DNA-processing protein DprA [Steroidobacteraceae bacterium]|jgi:DNA processing protein
MDAVELQLTLGHAGLSARKLRQALESLGVAATHVSAVESLLGQPATELRRLGLPRAASAWLAAPDSRRIEAERRWQERQNVALIDCFGTAYPPRLAALGDAPALLYVRGDGSCLGRPQIAMVGTRMPTQTGLRTARQFAASLVRAGLAITSGLAFGIDAASHHAALVAEGHTVAVVGSGLDQVYPPQHERLAERIVSHGALVSELAPGTAPVRWSFPRRNRLISGLSLATLVVEAAGDSGSLSTARQAIRQGKPLFAIPSSIHNFQARGCHQLIREGARLVETAADIVREIAPFLVQKQHMSAASARDRITGKSRRLDKGQKILLDALGFEPASIDTLVGRTGFPSQSVASMLMMLELAGAVGAEPGGHFVRLFDERHG